MMISIWNNPENMNRISLVTGMYLETQLIKMKMDISGSKVVLMM